ncbi:hypothetical protein P9B81_21470, partial [Bacillus paralicheniformis]
FDNDYAQQMCDLFNELTGTFVLFSFQRSLLKRLLYYIQSRILSQELFLSSFFLSPPFCGNE